MSESSIPGDFRAFRIHDVGGEYRSGLETVSLADLSEGEITIRVEWSGINYKDALAATGKAPILRRYPLNGGIDVAGTVVESRSDLAQPGDRVLANGSGLSETRDGGYSEYLKLTENIVVPLPGGLSPRESMGLGTAGFTAALCLYRMEANGQRPDMGPVVVTGATGGVGSIAVDLLTSSGYEVHAISGKVEQFDWLEHLGAKQCISRKDLYWGQKPLETATWAGAIDNVGGEMLAGVFAATRPWGNIACCGMAGGHGLHTTVYPMIIRGVSLLGISSANCPIDTRRMLWDRLGAEWKPPHLDEIITREVSLDAMEDAFDRMLSGCSLGRTVVNVAGSGD